MRKKIFIVLLLLIVCGAGWGYYLFNKPRTGVASLKADVSVEATDLFSQYQQDENAANIKFLDKVIAVKGTVTDVLQTDSTLSISLKATATGSINCGMLFGKNEKFTIPQSGSTITVKGRCSGFLMDVNLTDCVIQK